MNIYDFDKTIYDGDSTLDFWMHCVQKYPKALLPLPRSLLDAALFHLKWCEREQFKETFYRFLKYIPDVYKEVQLFWDSHENRIKRFYWKRKQPDDLVISASPDFLIGEICGRLNISCIASSVNPYTGKLEGMNCRGCEKIRRFREQYPETKIERFYSDSVSDICIAQEAEEAFFVKGNTIQKWFV